MNSNQYPKAALVNLTLQNGNPVFINAHAVDSITVYGDINHSVIYTYGANNEENVVRGNPDTIRSLFNKAISDNC